MMAVNGGVLDGQDADQLPYRLGVGIVLFNADGLVWVGRRIAEPGQTVENYWQLPQGGIDKSEDPQAAALRELYEETGVTQVEVIGESQRWLNYDLPEHLLGVSWKGRFRGQSQKWFAMRFLGDDADFNLGATGDPEFDAWKWVEFQSLLDMIVPFKRAVYRDIVAEFSKMPGGDRSKA